MDIQRFLIGLGLLILAAGIMWPILSRIGLGKLPGDMVIQRGETTFRIAQRSVLAVQPIARHDGADSHNIRLWTGGVLGRRR